MKQIPIPASSATAAIESLATHILAAKAVEARADVSVQEREIDERVYAMYGLRPDEIRMIEESVRGERRESAESVSTRRPSNLMTGCVRRLKRWRWSAMAVPNSTTCSQWSNSSDPTFSGMPSCSPSCWPAALAPAWSYQEATAWIITQLRKHFDWEELR